MFNQRHKSASFSTPDRFVVSTESELLWAVLSKQQALLPSLQLSVARHSIQASKSQARNWKSHKAREDIFDKGRLLLQLLLLDRAVGWKGLEIEDRRHRSSRCASLDQAAGSGWRPRREGSSTICHCYSARSISNEFRCRRKRHIDKASLRFQ